MKRIKGEISPAVNSGICDFKIFILLLFFVSCGSTGVFGQEILKPMREYPVSDEDTYFRPIIDLEIADDTLYAVENFGHAVHMFSVKDGFHYLQKIGKQGQGPGDMELPNRIALNKDEFAVKDNRGISFFSLDGKYQTRFEIRNAGKGMVFLKNEIYLLEGRKFYYDAPGRDFFCVKELDADSLQLIHEYRFEKKPKDKAISLAVRSMPNEIRFYFSLRTEEDEMIKEYVKLK